MLGPFKCPTSHQNFNVLICLCQYRVMFSYFIEWQDKSFLQRIMSRDNGKEKNVFTIRINEADVDRARELVAGLESVKLRKTGQSEK